MKTYLFICLLMFLVVINSINAQQTSFFKINQASIQPFISQGLSHFMTNDEFQVLTDGNHGLPQDLLSSIGTENGHYFGWYGHSNIGLNANVGLQIRSNETEGYRKNVFLRAGLQFHNVNISSNSARVEYKKRVDTLTSNSDGSVTYVDSTERRSTNYSKKAEMLNVDAALIFHTNQEQQWSLFGGVGLTFGASLSSYTEVYYNKENNFELNGQYGWNNSNYYPFSGWNSEYKRFNNKTNLTGIIYLPMGVDMRLGNHKDFWKRLHVFYEFRPSLMFHHTPEIGTINAFTLSHGLGLNIRF